MPSTPIELNIDMPLLSEAVEKLKPEQIDALPFAAIHLDSEFKVVLFSDIARRQSGYRKETLNRPFFLEVAPSMNTTKFRERLDKAMAQGRLDISFDYTADLPSGAQDVDIHVRVLSASDGGCWVFTQIQD